MSPALAQPHPMPTPGSPRAPGRAPDVLREAANRCPAATAEDIAAVLGGREPMGVLRGYARAATDAEDQLGAVGKQ